MATNPTTNNDRLPNKSGGGNNLKQNYTAIKYGNDHGSIAFGKIHKKADVTSDIMLAASDGEHFMSCLLYTSPSPRDISGSRMPSSA